MKVSRNVSFLLAILGLLLAAMVRTAVRAGESVQVHLPSVSRAAASGATPTATHAPSHTPTATATHHPTHTPTATHHPSHTVTATATHHSSHTPTPTATHHHPSHTATATPTHHPSHTATATATPTVTGPVTGTVVIEGGFCCVGGTAGQQLDIDVDFTASSPAGQVTEMRVYYAYGGGCANATTMEQQPWQPFSSHQVYTITVAHNWVGFYATAQYRDQHGTLSPLICDDISVEGMPPPP